jgi:branched-chain amino acid transport system substrate-binding protein
MHEAIQNYFDHVNAEGGIHQRKLKLVALDDAYETDKAVANTKKLVNDEKVFALVGYYGSSPTTAAMSVFSAAKVPLVGTVSGAGTLRNPVNHYMFNVRASYQDETAAIVRHLASIGLKKIAVFYQNDGFGLSGLEGVTTAMKKYNLTPIVAAAVERNSLDVAPAVKKMAETRPEAIIMVTLYKPTAEFVRQMSKAGLRPMYSALSPVGADLLVAELGNEARGIGISQVFPYPWDDITPINKEYKRVTQALGKSASTSYYTLEGFADAKVLVEGLKRAGRQLTTEKLVSALEDMRVQDFGGYEVKYAPNDHNGGHFVEMTVIGAKGRVLR